MLPTAVVAEINGHQIWCASSPSTWQTYGVGDGPRFWTTPHGGTIPAAWTAENRQALRAYYRDQAMTDRLARAAKTTVAHAVYASVPVN